MELEGTDALSVPPFHMHDQQFFTATTRTLMPRVALSCR